MADLSASRSFEVAPGVTVAVRELTLGEIRAWLKEQETADRIDLVDASLFDDFAVADLCRMTDLSAEQADQLNPSQLRKVADVAREVNSDFFAMRGRLADLGRKLAAGSSSGPSAA